MTKTFNNKHSAPSRMSNWPVVLMRRNFKATALASAKGTFASRSFSPCSAPPMSSGMTKSSVPPAKIGGAIDPGTQQNLRMESFYGPNAGLTEMLVPAGYVDVAYDPVFKLSADGKRYIPTASATPTRLAAPGLPFSLVFRAEPGREDVVLRIASAYEKASQRRVMPPDFGPIPMQPR